MTGEVSNATTNATQKRTTFTFQAGSHAGIVKNPANEKFANIGLNLNGEVKFKNGTHLNVGVGTGTAMSAQIEAGHEFDLGKNFSLDLAAGAKSIRSNKLNHKSVEIHSESRVDAVINNDYKISDVQVYDELIKSSWNSGEHRAYAGAMGKYKVNKNLTLGLGIEGGFRSTLPTTTASIKSGTVNHDVRIADQYVHHEFGYDIDLGSSKSEGYVTPKALIDWKIAKGLSLNAQGDMHQGTIGLNYTLGKKK